MSFEVYSNPRLTVRVFDKKVAVGNEHIFYPDGKPEVVKEVVLLPDLTRGREQGWSERGKSTFLSTASLADMIVSIFVDSNENRARRSLPDVRTTT